MLNTSDQTTQVIWDDNHPKQDHILRPGLSFHFGCSHESQDSVCHGEVDDYIRLVMLLEGELDIGFGKHQLRLESGRRKRSDLTNMALVRMQEPEAFRRTTRRGDYSRRISLGISREWLEQSLYSSSLISEQTSSVKTQGFSASSWQASANARAIAEQMLNPPPIPREMLGLYLESRALELIIEGWSQYAQQASPTPTKQGLKAPAYRRMCDLSVWLTENAALPLTLDQIAQQAHTTTATLQRHFRMAHGMSVFDFLQQTRFEQARYALENDAISVSAAAELAGYTNPGSFSTAFKRHFGLSPKQVMAKLAH